MIEKLKTHQIVGDNGVVFAEREPSITELRETINEIIDELNHILEERESCIKVYEEVMPNMKPTDPYAEQRKWIGKFCKFWDIDGGECVYGVLRNINEKEIYPFTEASWTGYKYCEPVKPDDDVIYKGE